MHRAFNFRQLCERSDTTLRELLGKTFLSVLSTNTEPKEHSTNAYEFSITNNGVLPQNISSNNSSQLSNVPNVSIETVENTKNIYQEDSNLIEPKIELLDNDHFKDADLFEDNVDPKIEAKTESEDRNDDTSQPMYPCLCCTQVFTNAKDLRVRFDFSSFSNRLSVI